jgi:hypothetical protein
MSAKRRRFVDFVQHRNIAASETAQNSGAVVMQKSIMLRIVDVSPTSIHAL